MGKKSEKKSAVLGCNRICVIDQKNRKILTKILWGGRSHLTTLMEIPNRIFWKIGSFLRMFFGKIRVQKIEATDRRAQCITVDAALILVICVFENWTKNHKT